MPEEWIVDGYNLLHGLSGLNNKKIKMSRGDLLALLASFASSGGRKVITILDGKGNDEEWKTYQTKSFEVIYSQDVSADTLIERYLYQNKARCLLVVVTNDRAIAQIARGVGARVVGTKEFSELLETDKKENKNILFKHEVKAHGFNRPFQDKLKEKL